MTGALRRALPGLAGAAALIAGVTVVSRVLGFVRYLAQADGLGAGAIADAYNRANLLPNVLFEVAAGGALAGAVVPLLAGPLRRGDRREVDAVVSAAVGWTLTVLVPLGLLLAVLHDPLARLLVPDEGSGLRDVVRLFLLVFAPQVPLYGLAVLLYGVLQAHRRFFWPAFAPVMSSVVVITTYLVYGALAAGEQDDPGTLPDGAVALLAWGTTAGVAAMCLPMLVPVHRLGVRVRPSWRFPPGTGRRFRSLALAGVGAVVAQQVATLVVLAVTAARGGDGAYTVWTWTWQVFLLPYAVLVVPLATSTFPRLSERWSAGDRDGFARLGAGTTAAVLAAAAAGAAAVAAAAPGVAVVFAAVADGGALVADGMVVTLSWLVPGLVGFAAVFHGSRTLYAAEHGRAAVATTAAGWGLVAVLGLVLGLGLVPPGAPPTQVLVALAAASSAGLLAGGALVLGAVRRVAGPAAVAGLGRTVAVLALGGVLGAVAGRWVTDAVVALVGGGVATGVAGGAGGGLVALLVVGGAVALLDRRTVLRLTRRDGAG
ncbi:murein biosynthesis integral membrane protein MurJ [Cellulomonas endophytica]|uniref:murein biosynthesis integral membrane protein MurJ n=1 Tax=Cellulomonas endophytica TaxID=2494735 RepID=UPI0010114753|nr:lipid II flippase MurJ [Cellulomonas endophytica]